MTKYMGHLHAGDVITTVSKESGERVTVTIKSFSFDPTWGKDGSVLIEYHHEPSGKDGYLNVANLASWFKETEWEKVNP